MSGTRIMALWRSMRRRARRSPVAILAIFFSSAIFLGVVHAEAFTSFGSDSMSRGWTGTIGPGSVADSYLLVPVADIGDLLSGTWNGTLSIQGSKLPLVFHLSSLPDYTGSSLDSPAQGARGIPIGSVSFVDQKVRIDVPAIRGRFEGTYQPHYGWIEGQWIQGTFKAACRLVRDPSSPGVASRRPESPGAAENSDAPGERSTGQETATSLRTVLEVRIPTRDPVVVLAGSLVLPRGAGPFPAVLMLTGSGAQNRDEEILGHRPFAVLAEALAVRGIASLRCDDRGIAASTGDFASATSVDFAADAADAAAWLLARSEVDKGRCGILGHSEGGLVAAIACDIAAPQVPGISFLVLLASPALPGARTLETQSRAMALALGAPEAQVEESAALNRSLYAAAAAGASTEELAGIYKAGIESMEGLPVESREAALAEAEATVAPLTSPWMRTFLALNPASFYTQARLPVLAVFGSKDLQVIPGEHLEALRLAIPEAQRAASRFVVLPGRNHLFQTSTTGLPSEYGRLPGTMEGVGDLIVDYILESGHE